MRHTAAKAIANEWVRELSVYCERIEIAGSVRRMKPEVRDIEIVAVPKMALNLFGEPSGETSLVDLYFLDRPDVTLIKDGPKYKQIQLEEIKIDLFLVTPPAQWGVLFMIRTGSAEFSHRLVTARSQGGLLPGYLRVQKGAIWSHNHIIETPEEQDVFDLIGLPYIPPEKRTA